jgi:hypothetical protein
LLSQVTIKAIEASAGTRLMLHAAGLADADGRVLALVGPSGMGKTTASVYLAQHGLGYVSDETVSIGPEGDVLPFSRPLWLRERGGEVQRSPDDLGLAIPPDDLRIARIVLLDRIPGRIGPPELTPVSLVDALLEMIPQASALPRLPEPLQSMCRVVDRCGGVLRLTYGAVNESVLSLLSETLGSETVGNDSWQAISSQSGRYPVVVDRRLFQGGVVDGVVTDGEALVLVDDIPVRLSEIALTVWEAARDGVSDVDILPIVERKYGTHPNAARIVSEAVDHMLDAGLLIAAAHGAAASR